MLLKRILTFSTLLLVTTSQAVVLRPGTLLAPQQEYTFNLRYFPETLDPNLVSDAISLRATIPIFDTLYRLGPTGDFIPAAARAYKVSDDQLTWTFYLRPEATWQDGKPVTAHDFIYAWHRLADHNSTSIFANAFVNMHVVNADGVYQRMLEVDKLGVKALDDHTIEINLYQPTPWVMQIIAGIALAPVRQDLIEKYGSQWTQPEYIVGNGPYKLVTYSPNDQILYQKWDGYWDAKNIYLTQAKAIFTDERIAYYRYLTGELLTTNVFKAIQRQVLAERPDQVYMTPLNATYYVNLNMEVFKDRNVRYALALLTDNNYLSRNIVPGTRATTIFAPTDLQDGQAQEQAKYFTAPSKTKYQEAKELLAQAGYSPQKPLTFTLSYSNSRNERAVFVALQQMWAKNSDGMIQVKGQITEWKTFLSEIKAGKFEASLNGWAADYDHVSNFFGLRACKSPSNYARYCNANYDALLEIAEHTVDNDTRQQMYAQANSMLQEDAAILPLYWMENVTLKSPQLGGYNPYLPLQYFRDFYILGKAQP